MMTILMGRGTMFVGVLLAVVVLRASAQAPATRETASDSITPAMIARGDSIFHGKLAGGTCHVCHGEDAKGTAGLAPDLTSGKWLNGDGSYAFIMNTVQKGVPSPKESPAAMPPMGGVNLSADQIRAVAAYVYSVSRSKTRKD